MGKSLFPQPTGLVQVQGTQQHSRLEHTAKTEQQLRVALREIALLATSRPFAAVGASICIAASFRVSETVAIATSGLRIFALSYVPIFADGALAALFDVRAGAESVTIEGLAVHGVSSGSGFARFVTVSDPDGTNDKAKYLRLLRNVVTVDHIIVDDSAGLAESAFIIDNVQAGSLGTHSASISCDSPRWVIRGNTIKDGGGDAILLGAAANRCRITENDLDGADLTTSGSGGVTAISDNVDCGTLTTHATDAVGLNT